MNISINNDINITDNDEEKKQGKMGCEESKPQSPVTKVNIKVTKPTVDKKTLNKQDFMFVKRNGEEHAPLLLLKEPGSINGQQFIIEDCSFASILLLDHIDCVTVDDCRQSIILIGPTSGSVFLRGLNDCTIFVSCQQLRLRDCNRCKVFLFSSTRPIIESSNNIGFDCLQLSYFELEQQIQQSGLNKWNNVWYNVYDFTPSSSSSSSSGSHHKYISEEMSVSSIFQPYLTSSDFELLQSKGFLPNVAESKSCIPYSFGHHYSVASNGTDHAILLCFPTSLSSFVQSNISMTKSGNMKLIRSYEKVLNDTELKSLFQSPVDVKNIKLGPNEAVIVVEMVISSSSSSLVDNEAIKKKLFAVNDSQISRVVVFSDEKVVKAKSALVFESWMVSMTS